MITITFYKYGAGVRSFKVIVSNKKTCITVINDLLDAGYFYTSIEVNGTSMTLYDFERLEIA